ncbi:sulfatase family protein [Mycobacterium ulcerans str. Harvey]|uniref:Sulfatase family protein n=1 Tax=Mycobacterium ulcerans str. Harvey TaxID=1299332 RepID=A0ABP3AUD1_MYCUL|nr:sulfatase family protein [Mycobacterium ulcerans str. Harvey]
MATDIRDSEPDWGPFLAPAAPAGAPNVLMIVWDDVGYGALEPFGGPIETPAMRRIADSGVRYSNFHTTALCSPTRSSLLNGRNATSNNMACITEASAGFPGFSGRVPFENGMISEVLNARGWNTYAVGKWHLTPSDESDASSWKGRWPLGRGFERFYGFLGGETNQWYPDLVYDNHTVEPPATPEQGYHLSADLADKAIRFVRDAKAVAPRSRGSCTSVRAAATLPTTCSRTGQIATAAGSTKATRRFGWGSWPTRSEWDCYPRTSNCRRSTHTVNPISPVQTAGPGPHSISCGRGTH